MTKESAEIIAYISMGSSLIPIVIGILGFRNFPRFFKLIWASIVVSLLFDALSSLCLQTKSFLCVAHGYYSVVAIFVWGLAFRHLFRINDRQTRIFDIVLFCAVVVAFYFGWTNNSSISTNYPSITLEHLYIIGFSTILVMYYLILKKEIVKLDLPIVTVLSASIIHYSTVIAIFIFFKDLSPDKLMNLYLVKWILFILFNLVIAYVFYHVSRGKWKSV